MMIFTGAKDFWRQMRHWAAGVLLGSLAAALLAGGAILVSHAHGRGSGPVDSVSQVMAGLATQPGRWAGRTLLVRGVPGPVLCLTPVCRWPTGRQVEGVGLDRALLHAGAVVDLIDLPIGTGPPTTPLPLRLSYRPSWLGELSGVPVLRPLIPPAQALDWAAPAVYRVRLEEDWTGLCCEGVLLDAQP
jgi:hypothetical protein